jgi:hypothetical protein
MISVRIRKSAVASAFIKFTYRIRGFYVYEVRQTIADRRPKNLRQGIILSIRRVYLFRLLPSFSYDQINCLTSFHDY